MQYNYGEEYTDAEAGLGDTVQLQKGDALDVVACQETDVPMLNIDANQLQPGDLKFIKSLGLTISNPDTDKPVALGVDYKDESWGHRISKYLSDDNDNDDDSTFFGSGGFLGGGSSWGGGGLSSGGGFGGFGGGSFSGGGASGGF